ncbi:MAG TPA: nucleotidyltransferase domain-containing protein [Dehalococcoidia bacterium]|nr:nucleotidyltransferase domain-containing protein [Dehalococcoidia bacterium]
MSSSVLRWPDAPTVAAALRRWAERAAAERPELRRVGYAGSYARGDWGVGSDLDVVLVVEDARLPFWRRPVEWDLTGLPVPADVLVYTEAEWRALDPARLIARVLAREVTWVWPP